MIKYLGEFRIRSLAMYYTTSNFNEEYAEDLYQEVSRLAGKIARAYFKMSDGIDLEDMNHEVASEVLLRLKDGRAKPDMEAWTRYIMMRVRTCVTAYFERFKFGYESKICEDYDLSTIVDKKEVNSYEEVEYEKALERAVNILVTKGKNTSFFKNQISTNLLIYMIVCSLKLNIEVLDLHSQRVRILLSLLKRDLRQTIYG